MLGLRLLGVETDPDACRTADAAGHARVQADVTTHDPDWWPRILVTSPPCFVAGTPVLTSRGMRPIEHVTVGDLVWTHAGRWRPVTATMKRTADTIRIGPVVCTPDHPFLTRGQTIYYRQRARQWAVTDDTEWTRASQTKGRFLASPTRITGDGESTWRVTPWLAGRYLADGWTGRDGIMIAVGAAKREEFESRAGAEFQWRTSSTGANCLRFTTPAHDAASWLRSEFGHGAAHKTVPAWVLSAPEDARREFLAGYLSGDGARAVSGWLATTVSPTLAAGMYLLAIGLGYTSHIRHVDRRSRSMRIEGRLIHEREQYVLAVNHNDGRYTRDRDEMRWFKQRKDVEPAGTREVFDLTVDEDESFTAWGRVVHNCTLYSSAGHGTGRDVIDILAAAIPRMLDGHDVREQVRADIEPTMLEHRQGINQARPKRKRKSPAEVAEQARTDAIVAALVLEPARRIHTLDPEVVAMEQVPPVLPLWEVYAGWLRSHGWSCYARVLCAADYGVPQTRRRAILSASRVGPATPPPPTHAEHPTGEDLFGVQLRPWVTMAEALDLNAEGILDRRSTSATPDGGRTATATVALTRPAPAVTGVNGQWILRPGERPPVLVNGNQPNAARRSSDQPAPTVMFGNQGNVRWVTGRPATTIQADPRVAPPGHRDRAGGEPQFRDGTINITVQQAAILQSFPADFPWQGTKTSQQRQVGNAVPPLMAAHVLAPLCGLEAPA